MNVSRMRKIQPSVRKDVVEACGGESDEITRIPNMDAVLQNPRHTQLYSTIVHSDDIFYNSPPFPSGAAVVLEA